MPFFEKLHAPGAFIKDNTAIAFEQIMKTQLSSLYIRTMCQRIMGYSISNQYTPCGKFWKSVPQMEYEFSDAPTFHVIFKLGLSQGE